jgi:hypothetical protein
MIRHYDRHRPAFQEIAELLDRNVQWNVPIPDVAERPEPTDETNMRILFPCRTLDLPPPDAARLESLLEQVGLHEDHHGPYGPTEFTAVSISMQEFDHRKGYGYYPMPPAPLLADVDDALGFRYLGDGWYLFRR